MPMSKTGLQQTAENSSDSKLKEFKLTMLLLGWKYSEHNSSIEFYKGDELLKYNKSGENNMGNIWRNGLLYWPPNIEAVAKPFTNIDEFLEFYCDL